MKFHSQVEFYKSKWFKPVELDDDLIKRKYSFKHEIGTFFRMLGAARGFWGWILMPMVLGILITTLGLMWPWLEKMLIDEIVPKADWNGFWTIFIILFLVMVQNNVITHIRSVMDRFLAVRLCIWLRIGYYRRLSAAPLSYIERRGVGEHISRMVRDLGGLETLICDVLPETIFQVYTFLMSLFFLYILDVRLIIIVLVWEVFYFFSAHWLATLARKLNFINREAQSLASSRLQEGFHGVQTVKTFGHDRLEVGGYLHRSIMIVRVKVLMRAYDLMRDFIFRGKGVFPFFKSFLIMNFLYYMIIRGEMTYGSIFPVMAYLKLFESPMEKIVDLWQRLRLNIVWSERVLQIWDAKPAVVNIKNPRPVHQFKGAVTVDNVCFDYENGFRALHDVSMVVKPGTFAGIVGPSGSGKSTLLSLLIRLADPAAGSIRMDGIDIKEFEYSKYQNALGIVMQDTFISKESLRWNLMLSNFNASDNQMIEAMERCKLGNWFRSLPHGLDSVLNEGSRLSVGEKQRLGIVRALIRNSKVLIFDEPTSSLDLDTEREVLEVIRDVRKGMTAIMVTHRLNTIVDADSIAVMDQGRIVEAGTHAELLSRNGLYNKLTNMFYDTPVTA